MCNNVVVFSTQDIGHNSPDIHNDGTEFVQRSVAQYTLTTSGKRIMRERHLFDPTAVDEYGNTNQNIASNEATTQENLITSYYHTIQDGSIFKNPLPVGIFERKVRFELPTIFSSQFLQRHEYSIKDVESTLKSYKAYHMWHYSLLLQLPVATTAVKISHECRDGLIYGAKQPAIRQIISYLQKPNAYIDTLVWPTQSVLTNRHCEHRPHLPAHELDSDTWDQLHQQLLARNGGAEAAAAAAAAAASTKKGGGGGVGRDYGLLAQLISLPKFDYNQYFTWKDIAIVPFSLKKNNMLEMLRVVPADFYFQHCQQPTCLTQDPRRITISGKEYIGTLESFYFHRHVKEEPTPTPTAAIPAVAATTGPPGIGGSSIRDDVKGVETTAKSRRRRTNLKPKPKQAIVKNENKRKRK